jgi:hypothetical protein
LSDAVADVSISATSTEDTIHGQDELRVEAVGNKIACYYDGSKKIQAADDTFKDAGKGGPLDKGRFRYVFR